MKTDKYKDWESKFFDGEELTPEEELFLKNESKNPYFSIIKEEKQEALDLDFDAFLEKVNTPKTSSFVKKKSSFSVYWLAASLVLLMGIVAFWMMNTTSKVEPSIVNKLEQPKQNESKSDLNNNDVDHPKDVLTQHDNDFENNPHENKITPIKATPKTLLVETKTQDAIAQNQPIDSDYNPNYVIVNGKPIYNEQEAIAVAENAFNYFASNVTQTINQAENAQNISEDLIQTINF